MFYEFRQYKMVDASKREAWVKFMEEVDFPEGGTLEAVLTDYRTAAAIAVTGPVVKEHLFPPELLPNFGFFSSNHPLFRRVTTGNDTAFVYRFDTRLSHPTDLLDPEHWQVRIS